NGLEEAVPIMAEYYLKNHTAEQLRDYFMKFPNVDPDDKVARVLLRIEIIGAFEGAGKRAKEESAKLAAKTTVDNLFVQLKNDFKVEDMTPSILIKIGNYLRVNTSTPREALSFYDEAVKREDPGNLFPALLGRAECYALNRADFDKAITDFQRVLDESPKAEHKESALFRIIELLYEKNDYNNVAERAKVFLADGTGYAASRKAANVQYYLAQSYDKRNMREDAIAMYAKVWATYMGNIKISAPAMKRWMELLWERNQPGTGDVYGDRQGAYVQGAKYILSTQHFKDKMLEADRKLWDDVDRLVQQYEANPDIKSLKEIEMEKEQGR
ncbi:MAG TPA: tetratricopeptide repeat protein, partial [Luteolibacter sp.]|nr:tetratricopeptide repeat protein [Luteolibacter sp.]